MFLILETLLFQNMFMLFYNILYWYSDFDSNKKKKWSHSLKNMPYINYGNLKLLSIIPVFLWFAHNYFLLLFNKLNWHVSFLLKSNPKKWISGTSLLRRLVYPFIMKNKKLNNSKKIKYEIRMLNYKVCKFFSFTR